VTLLLWVAVERNFKKLPEPAGGVRILKRPGEIRAQCPIFLPLPQLGRAGNRLVFRSLSSGIDERVRANHADHDGHLDNRFAIAAAAFAITVKRNSSGNYDLRIDEKSAPSLCRKGAAFE